MPTESGNSFGVTLVQKDSLQPVCIFNQTEFCKFGQKCNKMQNDEICNQINCKRALCTSRHPKRCKYFSLSGICKFGQDCAFVHKKSEIILQIEETENKVQELQSEIELMRSNLVQSENKLLKIAIEELRNAVSSNTRLIERL